MAPAVCSAIRPATCTCSFYSTLTAACETCAWNCSARCTPYSSSSSSSFLFLLHMTSLCVLTRADEHSIDTLLPGQPLRLRGLTLRRLAADPSAHREGRVQLVRGDNRDVPEPRPHSGLCRGRLGTSGTGAPSHYTTYIHTK
jgi:hypothetical protein